jgi:uncharacterized protein with WD repeat
MGSGGSYFAYCSTLALYIYDLDDFTLKRIIAGHARPITGFCWSPHQHHTVVTTTYAKVVQPAMQTESSEKHLT